MTELDNEFFETYKSLERLCSDMYDRQGGVSLYIEDMERQSHHGKFAVASWEPSYQSLKHLRWVRNQIAHGSGEYQICEEQDLQKVVAFYNSILSGQDPLTKLRKYQEAQGVRQNLTGSNPRSSSSKSEINMPTRRRMGCLTIILFAFSILTAISYILITYL